MYLYQASIVRRVQKGLETQLGRVLFAQVLPTLWNFQGPQGCNYSLQKCDQNAKRTILRSWRSKLCHVSSRSRTTVIGLIGRHHRSFAWDHGALRDILDQLFLAPAMDNVGQELCIPIQSSIAAPWLGRIRMHHQKHHRHWHQTTAQAFGQGPWEL